MVDKDILLYDAVLCCNPLFSATLDSPGPDGLDLHIMHIWYMSMHINVQYIEMYLCMYAYMHVQYINIDHLA